MDPDVYETNDQIGKNMYAVEENDSTYFSMKTPNSDLIMSSSIADPSMIGPYKTGSKSMTFNRETGSYINETRGIIEGGNIDHTRAPVVEKYTHDKDVKKKSKWNTVKVLPISESPPPQTRSLAQTHNISECPNCGVGTCPICNLASNKFNDGYICLRGHRWFMHNGKKLVEYSPSNEGGCSVM